MTSPLRAKTRLPAVLQILPNALREVTPPHRCTHYVWKVRQNTPPFFLAWHISYTLIYRYAVGDGPGHVRGRLEADGLPVSQAPPEEGGDIRRHFNIAPGNYQLVYRALPGNPGSAPEEASRSATLGEPGVVYSLEYMKWGMSMSEKDTLAG